MSPVAAGAVMVVVGAVFEVCARVLARVVTPPDLVRSSAVTEPA